MYCTTCKILFISFCFMALIVSVQPVQGAVDPRFELDPQTLGVSQSEARPQQKVNPPVNERPSKVARPVEGDVRTYVIKPGDNLFKILMRDFGLSNAEAESFVDIVRRNNNIKDIRNLKVGSTVVIPPVTRKVKTGKSYPKRTAKAGGTLGGQTFRLESPDTALAELEASVQFRQAWDRMMPPPVGGVKPVTIQSSLFSLTFDTSRYPIYAAMNGGKILVDRDSSIPPLVKELIVEKDPSVKIVSESPASGRRFVAALLDAAGFYSVEEDFGLEFGVDPMVSIRADFKIEKTADSVLKQDVMLVNSGRLAYPGVIREILKKGGITAYEPFAVTQRVSGPSRGAVNQIRSRNQADIVDGLLGSLSIIPEKDKRLDIFAGDNNGISLAVNADRYFERSGARYIVTQFNGDPVAYTLYRLLETKGYRVAILDVQDDFQKVTEKLLSQIRVHGRFARHQLMADPGANYSLTMSGFRLDGDGMPPAGLFLTNLQLDPVVRDLLVESGYGVALR